MVLEGRHPAVIHVMQFFECDHLNEPQRSIAMKFRTLAYELLDKIPDDPELTIGLRKLLEAKDCGVRASLFTKEG